MQTILLNSIFVDNKHQYTLEHVYTLEMLMLEWVAPAHISFIYVPNWSVLEIRVTIDWCFYWYNHENLPHFVKKLDWIHSSKHTRADIPDIAMKFEHVNKYKHVFSIRLFHNSENTDTITLNRYCWDLYERLINFWKNNYHLFWCFYEEIYSNLEEIVTFFVGFAYLFTKMIVTVANWPKNLS